MSLASAVLVALLSLAPDGDRLRLNRMADDIAHVVEERATISSWLDVRPLPFTGSGAAEASALALVAIAWHESGLRPEVEDCRLTGDRLPWQGRAEGRSITAFQLMRGRAWGSYRREQLCSSPRLAAERALATLSLYGRCRSAESLFSGYASGDCGKPSKAARRQCAIWERLARDTGLDASCSRKDVR